MNNLHDSAVLGILEIFEKFYGTSFIDFVCIQELRALRKFSESYDLNQKKFLTGKEKLLLYIPSSDKCIYRNAHTTKESKSFLWILYVFKELYKV